jgi:photosystem II stability/assembly factor-like uncharacterized protein
MRTELATSGRTSRRLLGAALALLALIAGPAQAQEGGLVETFDDPALPGWEHSTNAQVRQGTLRVEPGGYAFHPGSWTDLSLEISAQLLGATALDIGYSSTDLGEYTLRLESARVALLRNETELARADLEPVPPGEWMRVTVDVRDGRHEIRRGERVAITVTDPDPLPPGGLMLRVAGRGAAEFDDLTLIAAGALPSPEPPESALAPAAVGLAAYQATEPWLDLGGPPGGIGYDIRMRPDNPDIMYVTDNMGGLFVSSNGGQTWRASNSGIAPGSFGEYTAFSATIDPHDYDVVWVGTQVIAHIYRSSDGGATWEPRDDGLVFDDHLRAVRGITIDPNNPQVIYAGLEVTAHEWSDGRIGTGGRFGSFPAGGEVYKSIDGGETWQRIWRGDSLARYVWIDPRDSNRVYVTTGIFDRDAVNSHSEEGDYGGLGILRSDDGGATWTMLDERNGLGGRFIPSLFMHPDDPDTLLAAVTYPGEAEGAYVTHDGGDTWTQVLARSPWLGMDAVEISTADPDIWYAAAENVIYRSEDAGQTWQEYSMGTSDRAAGVPIDLQADPRDPMRIFVNGYGGGNFVSADGGATWTDASVGYTGSFNPALAVAPGAGWELFAASNTGAFRTTDGGQTWFGAGIVGTARSLTSITFLASEQPGDPPTILAGDNGASVWRSTDGGSSWDQAQLAGGEVPLTAVRLSPGSTDGQTVYAGTAFYRALESDILTAHNSSLGFFRSYDAGRTWENIAEDTFAGFGILNLAVSPEDPEVVYAATGNGLYLSRDGGETWRHLDGLESVVLPAVNPPSAESGLIVEDVLLDPSDSRTVLAAIMQAGVYRSEDGGETWVQASAGMDPNEPAFDLVADPNRPGVFYVSTWQSGVFVTTDGGTSWHRLTDGLNYTHMRALALSQDGAVLYAGTRGRGVFRLGTPIGEAEAAQPSAIPPTSATPGGDIPTLGPQPAPERAPARRLPTSGVVLGLVLGGAILVALVLAFARFRRR